MISAHASPGGEAARREADRVHRLYDRPTFRGDCEPELGARPAGRLRIWEDDEPCPWAGCKYHLAIAINPVTGGMKELAHWDDGQPVCVLDLAELGGVTLDRAGALEGITRERVRQIEVRALLKLKMGDVEELTARDVPADDELAP